MEYATLTVMLALMQYLFFVGLTGYMRGKHDIKAPATGGHPMYERAYRVQHNTLEELIVFIPAVFAYALYSNAYLVMLPGSIFIISRFWYGAAYLKEPSRRGPAFGLTMLANVWLIVGALIGLGRNLL